MKIIHTDQELEEMVDQPTRNSFKDLMQKDVVAYTAKFNPKKNEWISRLILIKSSLHTGSKIPCGCSLLYIYKELPLGFDMGIKEIKIAESMDDFLDLYNDITNEETIMEIDKSGMDSK